MHQLTLEIELATASILVLLAVVASRISSRSGIPALVLFILLGVLAGSEGVGGIHFDDFNAARSLGTVALALILFAGGLESRWSSIRPVLIPGLSLATVGVVVTAVCVGLVASLLLDISLLRGLLLGAIVSSTDAAAVFGVLRSRGLNLKGRLTSLLEFESGANDPMAVFLTILLTSLIARPDQNAWGMLLLFVQQIFLGTLLGIGFGRATVFVINRLRLDYEGLYPVISLSAALLTYALTTLVGGSGFLAVYAAGLVMGNHNFLHRVTLIQFHDGLAWLMQIGMFLTLGLLVFPSQLAPVIGPGILLATFLIFVARPLAVFLSLGFSKMKLNKKIFVSWVGLRGAVPIVLATIPLTEGVPGAEELFNIVFFIVLLSVLLQGTTIALVGHQLRVISTEKISVVERRVASSMFEVKVESTSPIAGKRVVDVHIPPTALIVLLTRKGESYVPRGGTSIEVGDTLLIASRKDDLDELHQLFGARKTA